MPDDWEDFYDDPPEPMEPRPYSEYNCTTLEDGTIAVEWQTNDDGDTGYPGRHAQDSYIIRADRFEAVVGKSRHGILADVTVWLDGEKI